MNVAAVGVFELLILIGLGGGMGLPLGIPPGEPDPMMARIAPDDCLFYVTWAGVTQPDPDSSNQTEQLLAEPEIQQFVAKLESVVKAALGKAAAQQGQAEAERMVNDATRLVRILLTHPVAIYVADLDVQAGGPPKVRAGLVVRVGDNAAEVGQRIKQYQESLLPSLAKEAEAAGVTVYQLKPAKDAPLITWGVKGPYLFAALGEGEVDAIAARVETEPPKWFTGAAKALAVDRPATLSYLNTKKIIDLATAQGGEKVRLVVDVLGLGNMTAVASVTGLDQDGFVNRTLFRIEGQPRGIMALASDRGIAPADLRPIPADATLALAARFRPERILQTIRDVAEKLGPARQADVENGLAQIERTLGINLQKDILESLGDTWCVYNSPSEGGLVITGATAVIQIKDHERFAAAHAKLLAVARAALGQGQTEGNGRRPKPTVEQFRFADRDVYFFNARQPGFPLAPSWCLDQDQLIVGTFPQNVKAYLSRRSDVVSLAENPDVRAALGSDDNVFKLVYHDTARIFDLTYPMVPFFVQAATSQLGRQGTDINISLLPSASAIRRHLRPGLTVVRRNQLGIEMVNRQTLPGGNFGAAAPIVISLMLPAISSAREAARRTQSMNNLKQIALAMHNYHSHHKTFPPAYLADKDGKPLLSWRVAILPYLEGDRVYQQFHLDEPWDSEHNKQLLAKMPQVFLSPGSRHAQPQGKTNYLTLRSEDTVFPGAKGMKMAQIVDGTSKTIMAVEVNDDTAVPWTKPDDFALDPRNPTSGLIGLRKGGFNAAFCDGSVRFFSKSIDPEVLKSLFTRNGREVVDLSNVR